MAALRYSLSSITCSFIVAPGCCFLSVSVAGGSEEFGECI